MRKIKEKIRGIKFTKKLYANMGKLKSKVIGNISYFSPVLNSKIRYKMVFHKKLDLKNPKTFNEKLVWLKLNRYANDPLVIQGADKYMVRNYVEQKGLGSILNGLLGVWDRAEDIDWDALPDKFALKCNHGCGFNIICTDKSKLDTAQATKLLNKWLKKTMWKDYAEMHYRKIKPKIICEAFLEGEGDKLPIDYKFFCFNGEPIYLGVFADRDLEHVTYDRAILTMDWKPWDAYLFKDKTDMRKFPCPDNFEQMKAYARILSKDFPFVRVDFYDVAGKVIFGELTFTPAGCLSNYFTQAGVMQLGDAIDLHYNEKA